jgi:hypothetical protein
MFRWLNLPPGLRVMPLSMCFVWPDSGPVREVLGVDAVARARPWIAFWFWHNVSPVKEVEGANESPLLVIVVP